MSIKSNKGSINQSSKRANISSNIRTNVLSVIEDAEKPVSTLEIGNRIGRSWHTIQTHCLRLQLEGKITGFRVGNMNLWIKIKGEKQKPEKRH